MSTTLLIARMPQASSRESHPGGRRSNGHVIDDARRVTGTKTRILRFETVKFRLRSALPALFLLQGPAAAADFNRPPAAPTTSSRDPDDAETVAAIGSDADFE